MRQILWINPLGTAEFNEPISRELRTETESFVDVASFEKGPHHLDYNAFEMLVAPTLLSTVRWAERSGYDAAVIGCFYDPALRAARELADNLVITAPAEASLHLAGTLGERISILVGTEKNIPEMHENVIKYGFLNRLASFRPLGIGVNEYQGDPACTEDRLMTEAQRAIDEDGADVIVLGCTAQFGFYRRAQQELGIPVIDSAVAALLYAEHLASLRDGQGWHTSKRVGYKGPDLSEMDELIPVTAPVILLDPRKKAKTNVPI